MPVVFRGAVPSAEREYRILCYGDSFTVGFCDGGRLFEPYGRALAAALAAEEGLACQVAVCAQSGRLVSDLLGRSEDARMKDRFFMTCPGLAHLLDATEEKPDLVVLLLGSGDLGPGMDMDALHENICRLHEVCHVRGVRTLALAPLPKPGPQDFIAIFRARLANLLSWWVEDNSEGADSSDAPPLMSFADAADLVPSGIADGDDGLWDWDGFHLGPQGSRLLGRNLARIVAGTLLPGGVRGAGAGGQPPRRGAEAEEEKKEGGESDAASGSSADTGMEFWRSKPAEEPEAFLGNIEDDYARGTLDRVAPIRSLALLTFPVEDFPGPGQEIELRLNYGSGSEEEAELDAGRMAAIDYAVAWDGGVLGCVPEIEDALGLPWGGTAAELVGILREGDGRVVVRLRAVSVLRLVGRHPVRKVQGFIVALLQELPEWGEAERAAGLEQIEAEALALEQVFDECGELQRRSGYMAAGDFASQTLGERALEALAVLDGVAVFGCRQWSEDGHRLKRLVALTHGAVAALSTNSRLQFVVEPRRLLQRLRRTVDFLVKVQGLLRARLAMRRAMEDPPQE